jgi:hypothetical protein
MGTARADDPERLRYAARDCSRTREIVRYMGIATPAHTLHLRHLGPKRQAKEDKQVQKTLKCSAKLAMSAASNSTRDTAFVTSYY